MRAEREFLVMTPEYTTYEHIAGIPEGIPEIGRDVAIVWATSKKHAKSLGFAELKNQRGFIYWLDDERGDGRNPLQSLEVEEQYTAETCPSHQVVAHPPEDYLVGYPDEWFCETCGYGPE